MTINLEHQVWLNSSNALSYLTLVGNYTADVPIYIPHQFVLVLDHARLDAIEKFSPANNTESVETNEYPALIVSKQSFYSAVVSPGGSSVAVLSCARMPYQSRDSNNIVGPSGILVLGSGAFLIDGITVENCGLNNGNFAVMGSSRAGNPDFLCFNPDCPCF
jgi:hypothetical protein